MSVKELYAEFHRLTGDPLAASYLVLAQAMLGLPEWMTVRQAADYLDIGCNSVYDLCNRGELPHTRIGKSIRVRKPDIDAYLEANTEKPVNRHRRFLSPV